MSNRSNVREVIQSFGEIEELYEVQTFTGFRNKRRVIVSLLDLGPNCDKPQLRFVCKVEQEDGKKATGNNAATIDEAIAIVHWSELD